MRTLPFSGVMTAIATPFSTSGELDFGAFRKLLAMLKSAGTHGVVVAGTTGESPTLTDGEKEMLVGTALEARSDAFRIYVGTGSNSTRTTIEESVKYARFTHPSGARVDGVMTVVPYYNKPTQRGQFEHFSAVARAVAAEGDTPLCLYNVPSRTGAALAPATALSLFEAHENIVAIKEATGDVGIVTDLARGIEALRARNPSSTRTIQLLSGDDATYAPALLCGATGIISVTSQIIPKAMVAMREAALRGDFASLSRLHIATHPLNTGLFCVPNPIATKWVLARLGFCTNTLRAPLSPLEEKEQATVKSALDALQAAGIEFAKP